MLIVSGHRTLQWPFCYSATDNSSKANEDMFDTTRPELESDGISLSCALFTPDANEPVPGLVICHGMPGGPSGGTGGEFRDDDLSLQRSRAISLS